MIKNLQNKPRVFLSHSKKDKEFIHRLCRDLRSCQIEPWLDSQEIRHGRPWLDEIFESGIPTCDAILVYLTENSVESPMVKKEIDASIIKKLKESHVAFLPYVSQETLRDQLRMDIQALQTPAWNSANYFEMLPRVVAEIWHSYLDSVVVSVVNGEKVRRLEAELELEKIKKTGIESIFETREIADFDFIWTQFDYEDIIKFKYVKFANDGTPENISCKGAYVKIQTVIPQLDRVNGGGGFGYLQDKYIDLFKEIVEYYFPGVIDENRRNPYVLDKERIDLEWENLPSFINKLKMYGLAKYGGNVIVSKHDTGPFYSTDKLERFKYWLYYKGILSNEIKWIKA